MLAIVAMCQKMRLRFIWNLAYIVKGIGLALIIQKICSSPEAGYFKFI